MMTQQVLDPVPTAHLNSGHFDLLDRKNTPFLFSKVFLISWKNDVMKVSLILKLYLFVVYV